MCKSITFNNNNDNDRTVVNLLCYINIDFVIGCTATKY